ncbi:unnamed protein product [Effrenium voratum]|nr:unnamed protein product [Effrenium voratum]
MKSIPAETPNAPTLLRYAAICLPLFGEQFLSAMPSAVLPAMRMDESLSLDDEMITAVLASGMLINGLGKLFGGVLIDRYGARSFLSWSMLLMAAAALGFALGRDLAAPLLGFVFLKLCAAGGWLCACKLMEQHFPRETWSWCFAVVGVGSRCGAVLARLGLGALLKKLAWRHVAIITAAFMLLLRYACLAVIPRASTRKESQEASEMLPWWKRACAILCNTSMLLYFGVMAGATCLAASLDDDVALILQDVLQLDEADASMASAVFPAGLVSSLLLAAPAYSFLERRRSKFILELSLQVVLVLVLYSLLQLVLSGVQNLAFYEIGLFLIAFTVGLTYYVTPNAFPLSFGEDCAFASAVLDIAGLVAAFLFHTTSSKIFGSGGSWHHVLGILLGFALLQLLCTAVLFLFPRLTPHLSAEADRRPSHSEFEGVTSQIIGKREEQ